MACQEWEECFVVRRVHLPLGYYFGLSAATGDLADNHDVLSFKVRAPGASGCGGAACASLFLGDHWLGV